MSNNKKCCEPTEEEMKLIREGDFCAEEVWGNKYPTCPKCINEPREVL